MPRRREVEEWDAAKVSDFLAGGQPKGDKAAAAAYERYAAVVREQGVGGAAMLEYDEAKLADMGVDDEAHAHLPLVLL